MRKLRITGLLVCMIAALLVPAVAGAQDGPTPPELSDPIGTNVAPHGGYSTGTDYCLQCHDVHDATGQYALMVQDNVVAVCSTCHTLTGFAAPSLPGGYTASAADSGTVSSRGAYVIDDTGDAAAGGHTLGNEGTVGEAGEVIELYASGWNINFDGSTAAWNNTGSSTEDTAGLFDNATATGGLYCASCHSPHGDFGQMVNNWVAPTDENSAVTFVDKDGFARTGWFLDYNLAGDYWAASSGAVTPGDASCTPDDPGTAGSTCVYAMTDDTAAQDAYLYGYKLLSAYPNHTWGGTENTYNVEADGADSGAWCATCHTTRDPLDLTVHNHDTACYYCHGNESGDAVTLDFPHTSNADKFMIQAPDALCVTCHTAGNLP